ncbi:MAG: Rho termination factor N-terminal domain-containing protein, partial [Bacteroidota bacterium]|nr:Rho termination factor N-terminal domain-containing protein [Bacteroidota bacterium]
MFDIIELNGKKVAELRQIASKLGIARVDKLKKQDLVYSILDEQAAQPSKGKSGKAAPSSESTDNRRKRNKPSGNEESTPSDQPTRGRRTKKEDGKDKDSDDSKSNDQEAPKGDKDANR